MTLSPCSQMSWPVGVLCFVSVVANPAPLSLATHTLVQHHVGVARGCPLKQFLEVSVAAVPSSGLAHPLTHDTKAYPTHPDEADILSHKWWINPTCAHTAPRYPPPLSPIAGGWVAETPPPPKTPGNLVY